MRCKHNPQPRRSARRYPSNLRSVTALGSRSHMTRPVCRVAQRLRIIAGQSCLRVQASNEALLVADPRRAAVRGGDGPSGGRRRPDPRVHGRRAGAAGRGAAAGADAGRDGGGPQLGPARAVQALKTRIKPTDAEELSPCDQAGRPNSKGHQLEPLQWRSGLRTLATTRPWWAISCPKKSGHAVLQCSGGGYPPVRPRASHQRHPESTPFYLAS